MEIALVLLGALAGGVITWVLSSRSRDVERRDQTRGFIDALIAEVSVAGELADVDLDINNLDPKRMDIIKERCKRLGNARSVFDASSEKLGLLPSPLPEQIVRYYGRLTVRADKLEGIVSETGFFSTMNGRERLPHRKEDYEVARKEIVLEADIL